ncbi:MAG: xanthine dehydrogenase family protein molybdopterin-binding subunit [Haloarculaceae archaeon]
MSTERVETVESTDVDAESVLGSAVRRREDKSLITGEAEYTDDVQDPEMVHAAMVRSQYGHATIEGIDASAAEARDDVLAVFTREHMDAEGVPGDLPVGWLLESLVEPEYPLLAGDRVRFQGQPIAVVVAETRYSARDAADAVEVTYDRHDAVVDPKEAVEGDGPQLHEEADDNVAFDFELGDPEGTDEAFESADHTVELDLENQRLVPTAMEPRACVADWNPGDDELRVTMTSQNPHLHRQLMAGTLGLPEHKVHVRAPDVGGGFGSKIHHYPDEAIVSFAAKQLERPVKWQATRSEASQTDAHGRGHRTTASLALADDGTITGMRVETYADVGAYLSTFSPSIPTYLYATLLLGQYDIPTFDAEVVGAFTNGAPVDAYRGAGRPEAAYVIERLVATAARELDVDPAELRRKNFVPSDDFPKTMPTTLVYDSGDYEKTLDAALDAVDYEAFRERQAEAREEGKYLGIGFSCYIEACGLAPSELAGQLGAQAGLWESGLVRMHPSGTVTAYAGTSGHGQGHETTYAQVLSDRLGIPYDDIEVVEGDTDEIPQGMGTYGSRSAAVGGSALAESAGKIVEKAREIAAHHLEAAADDVEFEDGEFSVAGAPERSMAIQDVAGAAYLAHDLPEGMEAGLEETTFYDPENFTYPFGTHVAVVEVDPDTGEVAIERYVAVDDCGEQINPKIVEGQIHGGIAQGVGQALYEGAEYDENGTLLTSTLQDYAVPKAEHVPEMETDSTVTPCPHNPLGVKGVGEAGTIASPQAVVNAVVDALDPLGIEHIDMPLDAETVWQAMQDAEGGS